MRHRRAAILLCLGLLAWSARAQESAPVTVDASPTAAQLLQQAEAAAAASPAEAARLVQESVDRFAGKLVPWPPEPDRFRPIEAAAESWLQAHPEVLARWLAVEAPVAQRQLEEGQWITVALLRPLAPAAATATLHLAQAALDAGRPSEAWDWIARALRHPDLAASDRERAVAARDVILARWPRPSTATPARGESVESWQPLWSQPLATAWIARRVRDMDPAAAAQLRQSAGVDGSSLLAAPIFDAGSLLLSDGVQAMAFDRFSGSLLWSTGFGRPDDRLGGPMGDVAALVAADGQAVTFPGHALADQRSGPPGVLALDARTGRRLWDFRLDRVPVETMEELFPHGRPLIHDDVVVVQARKSNSRLESAAWVLGLDRAEERLRWATSLGAAGGLRLAASRPLGSPVAAGGDVVAASSLGVVARIDAGRGAVRWLRRWPPPVREPRDASPPWQLPSPVADDRLVAWMAPDGATLVGLEPADGRVLWTRATGVDAPTGLVRTLLMDSDRLYAVGEDLVAIPRADPKAIAWKLSERLGAPCAIRGEVSLGTLADGSLAIVVPTLTRVLVVAPEDGRVIGELPVAGGGNTTLAAGQLAIATADRLCVAMPGERGERLLRDRLAERPDDPRRGLALIELGRAWKRGPLMVDGALATAKALDAVGDAEAASVREEVIGRLLDAEVLATVGPEQSGRMLELAAQLARTPRQRAAVALQQADRAQAESRVPEAAEICGKLWADPVLAGALLQAGSDRSVAAGVLAIERVAGMGPSERKSFLDSGILMLRSPEAVDRAARARQLATLMESRDALRQVVASLPVASGGVESALLQRLVGPGSALRLAACGALEPAVRQLPGSLLEQSLEAMADGNRGVLLLHETGELVARTGPAIEERWRVPLPEKGPTVLAWSPTLCLWSRSGPDDGVLMSLDPSTGATRFRIDGVQSLFGPVPHAAGEAGGPDLRGIECLRAGSLVLLSRGDGEMTAIRVDGDGKPAWKLGRSEWPRLAADATEWAVALVRGPTDASEAPPSITLLDARDGSPWLAGPWPEAIGSPRGVRLLPEGLAAFGDVGVAMLELQPGLPPRWLQSDRRVASSEWRGCTADRLLVKDRSSDLIHGLSLDSGGLQPGILEIAQSGRLDPVANLLPIPEGLLAHRFDRVSLHDATGRRIGMDAVAGERRFDLVQPVRGAVVIADLGGRQADLGLAPPLLLRTLEPATGLRLRGETIAVQTAGERLVAMDAVDGWILLGLEGRTLAIPAPEGR